MGLDYSKGCVNFRDVGEYINLLADRSLLPVGRFLRGGKLEFVTEAEQIGSPGTIINLRKGPDPEDVHFRADYWHFPISNDHEKYNTADPQVRQWLNHVFGCLAGELARWPVLFHCTSGKDRTICGRQRMQKPSPIGCGRASLLATHGRAVGSSWKLI